jgi:catechol 2,3-dioxygenase-like lactoylglutathione lyase family enzyme
VASLRGPLSGKRAAGHGVGAGNETEIRGLRLVVTAAECGDALRFYRDVLGLRELADFSSPNGRVALLEAGRATLELTDPTNAEFDEVEVRRRVAEPTRTPWRSLNSRLEGPAGLQLTLFEELGEAPEGAD